MIQQFAPRSEFFTTTRNNAIHLNDLRPNLGAHFLGWHPPRTRYLRRFSARGHVAESYDDKRPSALRPGCSCNQRLARFAHTLKSFNGSCVGEIKMLQHLGGAPFSWWVRNRLLCGHAYHCRCDLLLQFLKTRVHEGYLPFPPFRLKCCANIKTDSSYHRKDCHEDSPRGAYRSWSGYERYAVAG